MNYSATLTQDEDGNVVLPLPDELGWKEGDTLEIDQIRYGLRVRKVEEISNIDFDIEDKDLVNVALAAHKLDVTMNDFICNALEDAIKEPSE